MSGPAASPDAAVPRPAAMSVTQLTAFGRERLSRHFFMRDFLYSEIAAVHSLGNVPTNPDLAIAAGKRLCEELLEPLQATFGRIVIRSAYRSAELNAFGHQMASAGGKDYNCASNARNQAVHIWDEYDADGCWGAAACIVVPSFWDRFHAPGDWRRLAWWVHDNLAYSHMTFFTTRFAFNLAWRSTPKRRIYSHVAPKGLLTCPGMPGHEGSHEEQWRGIVPS